MITFLTGLKFFCHTVIPFPLSYFFHTVIFRLLLKMLYLKEIFSDVGFIVIKWLFCCCYCYFIVIFSLLLLFHCYFVVVIVISLLFFCCNCYFVVVIVSL